MVTFLLAMMFAVFAAIILRFNEQTKRKEIRIPIEKPRRRR